MGVMYWQLNDIWAGASWSSIDVSGECSAAFGAVQVGAWCVQQYQRHGKPSHVSAY
jgi:hypothetical protein